jgi:hypothetical protein
MNQTTRCDREDAAKLYDYWRASACGSEKKKGRSRRSGQVQGGNAQEGPRHRKEEVRNAALQQYGTFRGRKQVPKRLATKILPYKIFRISAAKLHFA